MKFLRGIRLSLVASRMKVPLDPRLHLSRRVVGLEQPDDAGIRVDGFEHVLENQLFLELRLDRRRGSKPFDEGDDVSLLEKLGNGRQLEPRLFEFGKRQRSAARPELVQAQPDAAECRSASGDGGRSELRHSQEDRSRKSRRRPEDRRRREFERQCPANAFAPHV